MLTIELLDKVPPFITVVPKEMLFVKAPATTPPASTVRLDAEFMMAIAPLENATEFRPSNQTKLLPR
ncbi:MAG: hypothetical protein EBT07_17970 [Actinobacteria bacterium]|nr:hypothetical protein [Actinomycetota bacterium]